MLISENNCYGCKNIRIFAAAFRKVRNKRKLLIYKEFLVNVEKPSVFDPRGQSDVDPRKLFYFDPSKVLTGVVIFILPCLLLGLHLADAFAFFMERFT